MMEFKAKAKTTKPCAYARCKNSADKIYADENWKVITCSQAHADIARGEIDKIPPEYQAEVFNR